MGNDRDQGTDPAAGRDGGDRPSDGRRADGGDADIVEHVPADEAFELLGDETRLGILRGLFDADEPLGFSALRERVGTRDSGQFNYHLDRLLGTFVRQDDEGYGLTAAGTHVVGSILAGQYTRSVETDPVPVDAPCPACGEPLVGTFEDGFGRVGCPDCDRDVIRLQMPPGAFEEYPREEWPSVAERWTRLEFRSVDEGFCSVCDGPVASAVLTGDAVPLDHFDAAVEYTCERCGNTLLANAGASVVWHPAVVAFYHDHGIDLRATPIWELDWATPEESGVGVATVVGEDPLRVEVSVDLDGDRLVLVLDERGDVVAERRET